MGLVKRIHLCTALIERGDAVLLVANRYLNHAEPLWNLPGGRQEAGELMRETVEREVLEETGVHAQVGDLLYVSESYDGDTHFTNVTFRAQAQGEVRVPARDRHVVEVAWVARAALRERIAVAVVREPLLAALERNQHYSGFHDAGIRIVFNDPPSPHGARNEPGK
ncbi:NUDIX domain-containing protein [bacterium]|nr:MAG: NUDIX domain-containing protein [bacterium]